MLPDIKNETIKNLIKAFKRRFPRTRYVWAMLSFPLRRSSLHQLGWFKSAWRMSSIDEKGNPVPWLNYPAIHFIKIKKDKFKKLSVWEWGSGNSTMWWSKYSSSVTSVEYDKGWMDRVSEQIKKKNAKLIFSELDKNYPSTILDSKKKYDVIVVDGRMRVECATNALKCLTKRGVIIWDNTDRERYKKGIDLIKKQGFKSLDFYGPAPIDNYLTQTSIYYRPGNALDI